MMTPPKIERPVPAPFSLEAHLEDCDRMLDEENKSFDQMIEFHDTPIQRDSSPPKTPKPRSSGQFLDVPGVCLLVDFGFFCEICSLISCF